MDIRHLLKHRLLGQAGSLGGAALIMAMCGITTNVIWARFVPQDTYGGFKVIFAIVNMIGTVCLLGTGQATLMSAAQNADGNLRGLIRAKLIANFGGSLLLLVAACYYDFYTVATKSIAYGLVAAAILFPMYNITDLWTSWLNGKGRFQELANGRALIYILPMSSVFAVAFFSISELWHVAFIYFALTSIQNIVMLRRVMALRANSKDDEGILALGRHATLAMMLGSIVSLDVIALNHFFSTADVAVYSVALVLPDLIKSLLAIINQLFAPKVNAGQDLTIFWINYKSTFLALTIGLAVIGVVGFSLLPIFVPFFFSEKYIASAQYSKWLWLVMASVGSFGILGNALIASRKIIFIYCSFLGYPILLAILYLILIPHGVAGMVLARILAILGLHFFYALSFFLQIRTLNRKITSDFTSK
jgi:O-antigen/teichoic acid export membrane protein